MNTAALIDLLARRPELTTDPDTGWWAMPLAQVVAESVMWGA